MDTDNMRDYYLMSYSGDRIQAILGLREALGCDLTGAVNIMDMVPVCLVAGAVPTDVSEAVQGLRTRGWVVEERSCSGNVSG